MEETLISKVANFYSYQSYILFQIILLKLQAKSIEMGIDHGSPRFSTTKYSPGKSKGTDVSRIL